MGDSFRKNQDILTQLVHGVRFIDLSPDYFPENSIEYWLNEACPQKTPLLRILMDVKLFLLATKEIIVMNFRSFSEGFKNEDRRRNFKKFLEKEFENHILYERPVNPWNITLNEIWQSKKRLIITFDRAVQSENNSVWSLHINNELEHTKSIEVIRKVIDEEYDAKYYQVLCIHEPCIREPRVIMAAFKSNYIPDCYGISNNINTSRYQDPRSAADIISPIVLQIYNEQYFGSANIIALNFVDATGIVEFAIEWNKRRASPCYEYYKSLMAPSTIFYL
ncbi:uncharacterized protein LOC130670557 [Microplitis mediator]|uniref:uncharacterized protein LOC130670557 n=1 Tax=Microplitis mediator TaxID=375433 RepID=UPI002552F781|nr:uncharacterized protein LOC130670557 [Microplitis mediator]